MNRRCALIVLTVLCCGAFPAQSVLAAGAPPTLALSQLDGSTTPTSFTLAVDVQGASSAKLVLDGAFVGEDVQAPLTFLVSVAAGQHKVKVRSMVSGSETRTDAGFSASGSTPPTTVATSTTLPATTTTKPAGSTTTTTSTSSTTTTTTTTAPPTGGEIRVNSVAAIRTALGSARAGDVIVVADGEYQFKPRLLASASGSAVAPITLRGSRAAVLRTKNASGDYGLSITGDYWHIEGLTVAHATKGIVLDGSRGTVIDGVEVFDIGDEAIHFRACSSDGVLRNSFVHDTGRNSAQYGEGVYVGSANSNWSQYQCTDPVEGQAQGDNTERVLIENNVFQDVTAEGADLKEGTDSGVFRGNTFIRAGNSGQNSADSAVDAKGNNWVIENNNVSDSMAPWNDDGVMSPSEFLDGFQSHSVYSGYGTGNVFHGNRVIGAIPGFGIGLYPKLANLVTCSNTAPGAAKGLVGDNSKASTCTN